jgi:hypothetical protein
MRVVLLGKTIEVPDTPLPDHPENFPVYVELKKLIENEFFELFDRKIDIQNWGYIFSRASAHASTSTH